MIAKLNKNYSVELKEKKGACSMKKCLLLLLFASTVCFGLGEGPAAAGSDSNGKKFNLHKQFEADETL